MKKTFFGTATEVSEFLKTEGVQYVVSPGRRAPMHVMHEDCAREIAESGAKLVLLIGSTNGPDSALYNPISNPLTLEQQKEQFRRVLHDVDYEVVVLEDHVSDADWMKNFVAILKEKGFYDNAAVHFRGKAADAEKVNKQNNKPLSQYTQVFAEHGLTVWQSYNSDPANDLISATDIRHFDLNSLTVEQRALISAPDYIIELARAARAENPDRALLDAYNIPLTVHDLAFDRMRREAGISTAAIVEAAKQGGDVTLNTLEKTAADLVRARQSALSSNVTSFPAPKKPLLVIGNSVSDANAEILSGSGVFNLAGASLNKFQNDETYAELFYKQEENFAKNRELIQGADAYVVQSTAAPVADHTQLLLKSIHTLKHYGAEKVTAIVPQMADLRQDREFPNRFVSLGAELMALQLKAAGADKVVLFSPHSQAAVEQFRKVFGDNVDALSIATLVSDYLVKKYGAEAAKEIVCGAPDGAEKPKDEGQRRACDLSTCLRGEFNERAMFRISKVHIGTNETTITGFEGDVAGKNVVIIDDMIDGGGTMLNAAKLLKEKGAKSVTCVATHAILTKGVSSALEKLMTARAADGYAIDNLVLTDSIPESADKISEFKKQYPDLAKKIDVLNLGNMILDYIQESRKEAPAKKPAPALKIG